MATPAANDIPRGPLDVVTGAFSHTGRHIAQRLLAQRRRVRTLTRDPARANPFGEAVEVRALQFDDPDALVSALQGVDTLYNTYWQRFSRGAATFEQAVANTEALVTAARRAGVRRIVHISVTHADPASPLPYFRGKGLAEEAVRAAGPSCAIVRPALLFGPRGIVFEQLAWLCRHVPLFALFGTGEYPVQPVYVDDLAMLAARAGLAAQNSVVDAVGPERYSFRALVRLVGSAVGRVPPLIRVAPRVVVWASAVLGPALGDVLISWDEVAGIMAGYFASDGPITGSTRLSAWLKENGPLLGVGAYPSELKRHYRSAPRGGRSRP